MLIEAQAEYRYLLLDALPWLYADVAEALDSLEDDSAVATGEYGVS